MGYIPFVTGITHLVTHVELCLPPYYPIVSNIIHDHSQLSTIIQYHPLVDWLFFPNSLGSSAIVKVSEQVGAAKIRIPKVPKFPGTGSQRSQETGSQARFPRKGFQARFPSKVAKQGFQEQVSKQGCQEQVYKQGCQEQVRKQGSQEKISKQGFQEQVPST